MKFFVLAIYLSINLSTLNAQEAENRYVFKPEVYEKHKEFIDSYSKKVNILNLNGLRNHLNLTNQEIYKISEIKALPLDVKIGYLCFSILEAIPTIATLPYLANYFIALTPDQEHVYLTSDMDFYHLVNSVYHFGAPQLLEYYCLGGGILHPLMEDFFHLFHKSNYFKDAPYLPLTRTVV